MISRVRETSEVVIKFTQIVMSNYQRTSKMHIAVDWIRVPPAISLALSFQLPGVRVWGSEEARRCSLRNVEIVIECDLRIFKGLTCFNDEINVN